jgi:hypothetical protein
VLLPEEIGEACYAIHQPQRGYRVSPICTLCGGEGHWREHHHVFTLANIVYWRTQVGESTTESPDCP